MPLNQTQQQLILQWLDRHQKSPVCPDCGGSSFRINPELMVVFPLLYKGDQQQSDQSRGCPMVVQTCDTCANMRFYSAAIIGIVPNILD